MKKLITFLLLLVFVAATPASVSAEQYGQGTVLGEDEEEPSTGCPKGEEDCLPETGLAENITVGLGVLGMGAGYYIYRSKNSRSVSFK